MASILEQLAAELAVKTAKKNKVKGKYLLEVNGRIITTRMTKPEMIKQVRALACSTATINVFKLEGEVTTDIPVTINADKETTEETK